MFPRSVSDFSFCKFRSGSRPVKSGQKKRNDNNGNFFRMTVKVTFTPNASNVIFCIVRDAFLTSHEYSPNGADGNGIKNEKVRVREREREKKKERLCRARENQETLSSERKRVLFTVYPYGHTHQRGIRKALVRMCIIHYFENNVLKLLFILFFLVIYSSTIPGGLTNNIFRISVTFHFEFFIQVDCTYSVDSTHWQINGDWEIEPIKNWASQ